MEGAYSPSCGPSNQYYSSNSKSKKNATVIPRDTRRLRGAEIFLDPPASHAYSARCPSELNDVAPQDW
eukprot:2092300-Amphidinium_carterae.3